MFTCVCIDTHLRNNYKILIKEMKDLNSTYISAMSGTLNLACQNEE